MAEKKKLSEKADKRYRAKLTVGTGVDGKPIVKYASGKTKKELEANKEELRRTYITGNTDARRDITFGTYASEWYSTYKKPKLSPSSQHVYASTFNTHLLPALAKRQLRAVSAMDLQQLLNSKEGMSATSIGYIYSILRSVFRMATAHGILDRDPTLALIKPDAEQESRRALTEAETSVALKVGADHPEGLLLIVLYYTGARLGEALGLQWRDIDLKNRTIHIERDIDFRTGGIGKTKTPSSNRIIPIPDELCARLSLVRGIGETYIFRGVRTGTYLTRTSYTRMWDRLMAAMYKEDPSIEHRLLCTEIDDRGTEYEINESILTPHYFRHNYASVLYNADVDILSAQKFLGHKDVKTTLKIYAHLSEKKADINAEKVRQAFSKI